MPGHPLRRPSNPSDRRRHLRETVIVVGHDDDGSGPGAGKSAIASRPGLGRRPDQGARDVATTPERQLRRRSTRKGPPFRERRSLERAKVDRAPTSNVAFQRNGRRGDERTANASPAAHSWCSPPLQGPGGHSSGQLPRLRCQPAIATSLATNVVSGRSRGDIDRGSSLLNRRGRGPGRGMSVFFAPSLEAINHSLPPPLISLG